jgi:hypothetical protein
LPRITPFTSPAPRTTVWVPCGSENAGTDIGTPLKII